MRAGLEVATGHDYGGETDECACGVGEAGELAGDHLVVGRGPGDEGANGFVDYVSLSLVLARAGPAVRKLDGVAEAERASNGASVERRRGDGRERAADSRLDGCANRRGALTRARIARCLNG